VKAGLRVDPEPGRLGTDARDEPAMDDTAVWGLGAATVAATVGLPQAPPP
jgi:hypothetical protein